jgi:hypothetical protein
MAIDAAWPGTAGDAGDQQELNWWIQSFKDEMFHLAQQKGSKLRSKVRNQMVRGESHMFERLAPSDAIEKTTRHTTTPVLDLEHSRRKVTIKDFLWADLVDDEDRRRMLVEPKSEYSKNAGYSMGRKWDDLIIGSDGAATPAIDGGMLGAAADGTGAAVAFDTVNQQIPSGATGMTIAKLTDAKYIMDVNDVPMEGRIFVISPKALQDLLNTTEITSADYNSVKALVKGEINTFLGFEFVTSTRLPLVTAERCNVAFQRDCVGLAVNRDVEIKISERDDLSYAWQVFARFSANATRIDDAGVVNVLCTEA